MPIITVKLQTAVRRTFRVEQAAGMFDVRLEEPRPGRACHPKVRHELVAEVPGVEEKWTIGAIVGPSGSGKTTLAKAAFGKIYKSKAWPRDRAIIDVLGEESSGFGVQRSANAECEGRSAERRQVDESGCDWLPGPSLALRACVSIKDLTRMLAAVGLGSPPTWLKPYHVLSGGEKFRADLVRAVLGSAELGTRSAEQGSVIPRPELRAPRLVVMDEFSALLDRTVAKTASAALGRLLRSQAVASGQLPVTSEGIAAGCRPRNHLRLVAVTCHRDVLPWLSPDWTVELGRSEGGTERKRDRETHQSSSLDPSVAPSLSQSARLIRGRPRRPVFRFTVDRVPQAMWTRFSGEHYLSGGLAASATCYGAFWGGAKTVKETGGHGRQECLPHGEPIGFCAVVACLGWRQTKRIQRLVVLPEFQGMGIGGKLLDMVAADQAARGFRVTITASHPAVLAHCGRSDRWRYLDIKKLGSTPQVMEGREIASSVGRAVAAFEWVGNADCGVRSAE